VSESLEVIFLGTGTSHGIPMIGCDCPVCRSPDPRDRRYRTSVALRVPWPRGVRPRVAPTSERVILIDTPPEFRLAVIAARLPRVDAVLFTHAHADHILGLDDIRRYNNILGGTIPCYGNAPSLDKIRQCFGYAAQPYDSPDRPSVTLEAIAGPQEICGVTVRPVPLVHGRVAALGYRIGDFAYCTDCSEIPPESLRLLEGLDLLVLDALRYTPHPAHFNFQQALETVRLLRPRRALLTHIAHEVGHAAASAKLPEGVELAHDGLRVQTPV
jgi:phosphoribosyl 1,2-cyclic phosphate phosphodiesterase